MLRSKRGICSALEGSHPSCFLFPVLSALHCRDLTHSDQYQHRSLIKRRWNIQLRNSQCCQPWPSFHSWNDAPSETFSEILSQAFLKPQAAQTSASGHKCSKDSQAMITEPRVGHHSVWDGTLGDGGEVRPAPKDLWYWDLLFCSVLYTMLSAFLTRIALGLLENKT